MLLIRSIATIGAYTAISRILGFIRDALIAALLGAGPIADAFFVSLRFPNMFRALFAEGAFSAAFVPLFVAAKESEGEATAREFAVQTQSVLATALLVFLIAVEIAMPIVLLAIAPGFRGTETFDLAAELSRITFPYLMLISLTALYGGVLNSYGRFAAPAAAPILLNLSIIGALVGTGSWMPTLGHALAWGVVVAGLLQLLWLLAALGRMGVWLPLRRPRLLPRVKLLLRRAVPVAFGAGIHQVNILVDTVLASFLPAGSVSYLFYADRLSQLPYGIIAAAVSTALLPILSKQLRTGAPDEALASQNRALEFAFLLMLPAATALIVLAEPFMALLFGRGAFDTAAVQASAAALAAYSAGLPAYLVVKALTPGYYAREDTRTPVKIAGVAAILHAALSIALMIPFDHVGIALSTALAAWFNAVVLATVLYRRGHLQPDARLKRRLPRIGLASAVMGLGLIALNETLVSWLNQGFALRAGAVALMIAAGLVLYGLSAQLLGAASVRDVRAVARARQEKGGEAP